MNPKTRDFNTFNYSIHGFTAYPFNVGKPGKRGCCIFIHVLNHAVKSINTDFEEPVWFAIKLKGNDTLLFGLIYRRESLPKSNSRELNYTYYCHWVKDQIYA